MSKKLLGLLKIVFAFFFGIIACVFLFSHTILNTTIGIISRDNIVDTIKNIDIVDIIGEDTKQEIYATLEKAEIPTEYIDHMLEDEKLKETVGEYVALSVEYVLSDKGIPEIDENEVTALLITSFDRVIEEVENHNIDVSAYITEERKNMIHEKIEYYVPEVVAQIPVVEEFIEEQIAGNAELAEAQRKIEEFNRIMDMVEMVYSYKDLLLIGVIIPLIIITIIKRKKFKFIKWLAFPFLFTSLLLKIIHLFIIYAIDNYMPPELSQIESIINPSIDTFISGLNNTLVIYFIIGIVLILIQTIINLYIRNKQEEIVL